MPTSESRNRNLSGRWAKLCLFCLANLFGGSVYAWSVFAVPIAQKLADSGVPATPADLSFAFSIAMAGTPIGMVAGGWLNDRFGPRVSHPFGAAFMFAGLFLASHAPSVLLVNLAYGFIYGIGSGANFTSATGNAIRLFPERRGFASGLAAMAFGMSSIIAPLAAAFLMERLGAETGVTVFAAAVALTVAFCGLAAKSVPGIGEKKAKTQAASPADLEWRAMLATPVFWLLFFFMATETMAGMTLFSQMAAIAKTQIGLAPVMAALSVSMLAAANTGGRFIAGAASDRFGRIPTLIGMTASGAAGLALLWAAGEGDSGLFFAGLVLTGLPFGGFMGIYPSEVADLFGPRHVSMNYGLMAFSYAVSGFIGPFVLRSFASGADFSGAYAALLAVTAAGLGIGLAAIPAERRRKAQIRAKEGAR